MRSAGGGLSLTRFRETEVLSAFARSGPEPFVMIEIVRHAWQRSVNVDGEIRPQAADEVSDRREVRFGVAGERDEQHVDPAGALDRTRTGDALRIRQQHRLQQHGRSVRRRPDLVIAVSSARRTPTDPADRPDDAARARMSPAPTALTDPPAKTAG